VKAIVIDDSRATRTILKRTLTAQGFEVFEAGDGRQAVDELLKTGPLDLALVDWNMPVMTGYEFIVDIRGRPEFASMSIMMVTTESLKEKLMLLGLSQDP